MTALSTALGRDVPAASDIAYLVAPAATPARSHPDRNLGAALLSIVLGLGLVLSVVRRRKPLRRRR